LHPYAQFPTPFDGRFGSRNRLGDSRVVQRALVTQACHGRVDGVGIVTFAREALTNLLFRELAAREQFQAVEIRR
jgi:hypothetical protein